MSTSTKNYRELLVWQKAMDLVEAVYVAVKKLPPEEKFEISAQMRRAAVSVPSNIAEGQGRNSTKDFVNFLSIARGSCAELQTQLLVCERLGYFTSKEIDELLKLSDEINRMLSGLINKLNEKF